MAIRPAATASRLGAIRPGTQEAAASWSQASGGWSYQ